MTAWGGSGDRFRPIRGRSGDRHPLTAIELDILEAIARGQKNAEIAKNQYRSVETVRSHVRTILRKLGARNRAHAVAIAYHTGIFHGSHTTLEYPETVGVTVGYRSAFR
ncbi:response regulator transcription factor [Amycolatopsis anabasis]|uniref:response regulator transcription factor n=1 Tax=Amycolatopsis anabasis TaxID=1840409 RepID=UPI00131C4101|nr:helix-turn-helix transcriptional regulator [Amycolatopsis anabasis]